MATNAMRRSLASLLAAAMLSLSALAARAEAPISIDPKTVQTGAPATITVSSSGFLDLSTVTASQVSVNPSTEISNLRVSDATARKMSVSFDLGPKAAAGDRMLSIAQDDVTVSVKFSVTPRRDTGACDPACRPPRSFCNEENGVCEKPVRCVPRCTAPRVCVSVNPNSSQGRCEIPK